MRIGIQTGVQITKGGSFIDPEAQILFDRVIADGGIVPAGLAGMDAYIKAAKAARGISTLAQGYLSLAHPHYTGIRLATGTGPTAGNRAARTVYNAIGATGDFIQTTAANQPLALVHSGTNYVWLPGVSGNYFSTPSNVNNELTTDFSFEAKINVRDITATSVIVAKDGGSAANRQFQFRLNGSRLQLIIDHSSGTQIAYQSTALVPFANNQTVWVRCSRVQSTGIIQFFTSTDGVTYTQLGSNVAGVTNTLSNPNRIVEIGSVSGGLAGLFGGEIFYVNIYKDATFTTPTQIFNPVSYNRANSQTSWTSSTGETWTLNTPATNNALKAAIVDTTMLMANGTSYGMQAASLNMNQSAITSYTAFRKYVNTAGLQIINELGANIVASPGKALAINTNANQEDIWISANVGGYNSRFTSTSLGLKLATAINNISNANESSPYLINNSSQSFVANDSIANNTANMNATGYNLLARNNASSLWANAFIVADCVTIGEDNTTQQTSMYNFFKTYINGI